MRTLFTLLLTALLLSACGTGPRDGSGDNSAVDQLPPGDAARGEVLFASTDLGAPACTTCHALDTTSRVGPGMGGYSQIAGQRVDGFSAEQYSYQSIVNPAAYLVEGYANVMSINYAQLLTPQQIADLIAYMLTL